MVTNSQSKDDEKESVFKGGFYMKKMKKLIAVVICLVMCLNSVAFASSETADETDIYAKGYEETLIIEGVNYTYRYSYDNNGNREIRILNNETNEVDIVKYYVTTGNATLNGMTVITTVPSLEVMENEISPNADYTYVGKVTRKISWAETAAVSAVVGLIASAIGKVTGAMVLAKIGSAAIKAMIRSYRNATVVTKIYEWVTGKVTNYKYVWTVTPVGGSEHGPYTSYMAV